MKPIGVGPGTISRPSAPTMSPTTRVLMSHQSATPIKGRTTNSRISTAKTARITSSA